MLRRQFADKKDEQYISAVVKLFYSALQNSTSAHSRTDTLLTVGKFNLIVSKTQSHDCTGSIEKNDAERRVDSKE
ncbi:MAG: hypothetical protein ACUVRP_00165 [Chlorobiales bacterium]